MSPNLYILLIRHHFYVFSSNAHPFEPDRAYSKFTAYTLLNFGARARDFHQAAVDLAAKGYVDRHGRRLATGSKLFGAHRPFGALGAYGGVVSRG